MTQTSLTADQTTRAERLLMAIREVAPQLSEEDSCHAARTLAQMDMDKFEAVWQRRKSMFPDHLSVTEGRIIGKVLDAILAQPDYSIEVHDECEKVVNRTRDRNAIEAETAASGMTYYIVFWGEKRVGFVMFVHGNEADVLCDYTANDTMDTLLAPANLLAEEIG